MRNSMAKSPMDDVGETIKNVIFWKVKSGQIAVHTPKEFSDAAIKFVSSIITLYLPKSDELVEPESIHQAPSIPETLLIHKFVRQINDRGDCSIEFFKTGVDQETFHIQWYKELVMLFMVTRSPVKVFNVRGIVYRRREWMVTMSYSWTVVSRNMFLTLKSNF